MIRFQRGRGKGSVDVVKLDLGDLAQVRACADQLLARERPLHVLINNAGLAGPGGLTKDGFELTFGTNHLGHFLFTTRLLPKLVASAKDGGARIVNVSSKAHLDCKGANVLFTRELARRLEGQGVTAYALHPGVVASDVWRKVPWPVRGLVKLFMLTNEQGAMTQLYCATAPGVRTASGRYYDRCAEAPMNPLANDAALAAELWRKSEAWTAPFNA